MGRRIENAGGRIPQTAFGCRRIAFAPNVVIRRNNFDFCLEFRTAGEWVSSGSSFQEPARGL